MDENFYESYEEFSKEYKEEEQKDLRSMIASSEVNEENPLLSQLIGHANISPELYSYFLRKMEDCVLMGALFGTKSPHFYKEVSINLLPALKLTQSINALMLKIKHNYQEPTSNYEYSIHEQEENKDEWSLL